MKIEILKQDVDWVVEDFKNYKARYCVMPMLLTKLTVEAEVNGKPFNLTSTIKYQEPRLVVQKYKASKKIINYIRNVAKKEYTDVERTYLKKYLPKTKTSTEVINDFEGFEKELMQMYFKNQYGPKMVTDFLNQDNPYWHVSTSNLFQRVVQINYDTGYEVPDIEKQIKTSLSHSIYEHISFIAMNEIDLNSQTAVFDLQEVLSDYGVDCITKEMFTSYRQASDIVDTLSKDEIHELLMLEFDEDDLECIEDYFKEEK